MRVGKAPRSPPAQRRPLSEFTQRQRREGPAMDGAPLDIRAGPGDRSAISAAIFNGIAEGIAVLDLNFHIREINPAFTAITGLVQSDVVAYPPLFLAAGSADPVLTDDIITAIRRHGRWSSERWFSRKDGTEIALSLSVTATTDAVGAPSDYLVIFTDVTRHKQDEQRIRQQASVDSLTGLPNRSMLMGQLDAMILSAQRTSRRLGVMSVDLDGFKLVNDTLGHAIGDELLQAVAGRLSKAIRPGDILTRFGGDEFIVLMPNVGPEQGIAEIAQRIVDSLGQNFALSGTEMRISASIGITTYPEDAQTVQALLQNATAAMTRAKNAGKAHFQFYNAGLDSLSPALLSMRTGLSKALDQGEFELFYQPKANIATGRLTGVEALLRWRSPHHGLVMPGDFIPVLEETGMIGVVGDWVLDMACQQYKAWADAGHGHMRVAVNLSVRQLRQGGLVKTIETLLSRYDLDASALELEITETMIMKDTENAVQVLRQLSAMGLHLTMDDFGTGYSSLSYLKRFPQNSIKIDRSFVADIAFDPNDLEIVRTVIQMGHSLRRMVVAEGVETEEQRRQLLDLQCDEMQGFLLSRPVPAQEIDRMLAERAESMMTAH